MPSGVSGAPQGLPLPAGVLCAETVELATETAAAGLATEHTAAAAEMLPKQTAAPAVAMRRLAAREEVEFLIFRHDLNVYLVRILTSWS